jgi:hypothetical protein
LDGETLLLHLCKEVPGTNNACQAFFKKLRSVLCEMGHEVSRIDPCLYWSVNTPGRGMCHSHVDDVKFYGTPDYLLHVVTTLNEALSLGSVSDSDCVSSEYTGIRYTKAKDGVFLDTEGFILSKCNEMALDRGRAKDKNSDLTPTEQSEYRSCLGCFAWGSKLHPEVAVDRSLLAGMLKQAKICDVMHLNKCVRYLRFVAKEALKMPILEDDDLEVLAVSDSSLANTKNEKTLGGYLLMLASKSSRGQADRIVNLIEWKTITIRRVCNNIFDAECLAHTHMIDSAVALAILLSESVHGRYQGIMHDKMHFIMNGVIIKRPPLQIWTYTDSNSVVEAVERCADLARILKRRRVDVALIREMLLDGDLEQVTFVPGVVNPADVLTKKSQGCSDTRKILLAIARRGVWMSTA